MADEYDEYEEEEEAPKKPKKPRKPVDWPLVIMLVGAAVFLLVFGAITLMAPRRPFLALRSGQSAKPAVTVVAGASGSSPAAQGQAPATTPAVPAQAPAKP